MKPYANSKSARITKSQCPFHRKSRWCGVAYVQASGALALFKTLPELRMIRQVDADLAKHPFVFGVSTQDVGLLADCALKVHFRKGELIFSEGEKADKVYLIESGTVSLEACYAPKSSVVVDIIGAGELLGLSWLFPPHRWRVSARACESTTAIVFIGAILREYSERDHSLGYQLVKRINEVMARRLESSRQRLLEFAAEHRTSRDAPQQSAAHDDERRCE
jgi:CRP/FNR family cyclic AMP-dependent transcriptional regulator